MKSIIKTFVFCLCFILFVTHVKAQVTVVNGPSDHVSNPPATASAVSQILANGGSISLKIGNPSTSTDINYQWYKIDSTGVKRLVQSSTSNTLTETATGAGYYIYQLLITNSNQCSSEISDPFKVYVLPTLNPTIAASSGTICSNGTSTSTLVANTGSNKYTYLYQWGLNGSDVSGATSATFTTPANTTASNTYSVKVSYALSASVSGTASQLINVIPVPTKPAISVGQ